MTAAEQARGRQTKRERLKLLIGWTALNEENEAAGRLRQGVYWVLQLLPYEATRLSRLFKEVLHLQLCPQNMWKKELGKGDVSHRWR